MPSLPNEPKNGGGRQSGNDVSAGINGGKVDETGSTPRAGGMPAVVAGDKGKKLRTQK